MSIKHLTLSSCNFRYVKVSHEYSLRLLLYSSKTSPFFFFNPGGSVVQFWGGVPPTQGTPGVSPWPSSPVPTSPHCPAPPPQVPPLPPVPLPRGPPPPRFPRPQVFLRPRPPCPPSPTAGALALARLERTHRAASRGRRTAAEVRAAGPGERRAPPGEPRVSFDQIRRRSLGGAGGAAGRASAPGLRGGAGDPSPLFAAGVSSVLRRRGRRLRDSRRVPSARRPGRGGAGERGGGAATYRVRRSGRRTEDGGCGRGASLRGPRGPSATK